METSPSIKPFPLPPGVETPALVVDLQRVERNVAQMAARMRACGLRLRPHVKTHKSVRLARMQLDAGAAGITVGTLGEAEVMAGAGIDDIFIAYPLWAAGEHGRRLRALHEKIELRVGTDSTDAVGLLAEAVRDTDHRLKVLIEVDSGGRRSGVGDADSALEVARAIKDVGGLELVGVFTHGGHSYASPDAPAGAAQDEARSLSGIARALRDAGFEIREVSAGSTPTAAIEAVGELTEERPGTYIFGDRQQVALGACAPDAVALVIASTVVSRQVPGQVVLDAGAKTLARERTTYLRGIASVPALGGAVIERAMDYHGIVELAGDEQPALGTVLAVAPNHVCPVVNLAREFVVVRADGSTESWPVDARALNG